MTMRLPEWRTRAACRGRFDLDFIDPRTPAEATECRSLCAGCPVREQCLGDALDNAEAWGIWGGLDTDQREQLAEQTGHPAPAVLPAHGMNSRYTKHGCRCAVCREAHTAYERARRERRRTGDPWVQPIVLAESMRNGRGWASAGQYVLPLPGVPAPNEVEAVAALVASAA
jgi:hypothetical protein